MPFRFGQVPVDLAAYEAAKASEPEFYRAGDSMLYGVRSYSLSCLLAGAWRAQLSISGAECATMCTLPMACPLLPVLCVVVASSWWCAHLSTHALRSGVRFMGLSHAHHVVCSPCV